MLSCFWTKRPQAESGTEVVDTEVRYQGGQNDNPTYRNNPGHTESIEITYDPSVTSFKEILDFFFRIHNFKSKGRNVVFSERWKPYRSLATFFWHYYLKKGVEH